MSCWPCVRWSAQLTASSPSATPVTSVSLTPSSSSLVSLFVPVYYILRHSCYAYHKVVVIFFCLLLREDLLLSNNYNIQMDWFSKRTPRKEERERKRRQSKRATQCWPNEPFLLLLLSANKIATLIIHLIALIMTAIMIYHIRSKYTAVGKQLSFSPFRKQVRLLQQQKQRLHIYSATRQQG